MAWPRDLPPALVVLGTSQRPVRSQYQSTPVLRVAAGACQRRIDEHAGSHQAACAAGVVVGLAMKLHRTTVTHQAVTPDTVSGGNSAVGLAAHDVVIRGVTGHGPAALGYRVGYYPPLVVHQSQAATDQH